jgi:hypothetical protein
MLMKKLTEEGRSVETAVRHSARAPAEGTTLQPEEDKGGRAVRQGQIA